MEMIAMAKRGRPEVPDEERRIPVTVSLKPDERERLREVCERFDITQSDLMRLAIENADLLVRIGQGKK